jgi:methionyl aminopeptidase
VLLVKNRDQTKMEEGEYYAIETFGSTGRGKVVEEVRVDGLVSLMQDIHVHHRVTARTMQKSMMGLRTRP